MTNRNQFIKDLFLFLRDKDYVVLKYIEDDIASIGALSDIDLAVSKKSSDQIEKFITKYESVLNFKAYRNSFMKMVYIAFNDSSFLEVDLINSFIRKDIHYLDTNEMLTNYHLNHEQLKVPHAEYSFLYIFLFYILNGSSVDTKYQRYFTSLSNSEQSKILNFMNQRYTLDNTDLNTLCIFDASTLTKVKIKIKENNGFFVQNKNLLMYMKDFISNNQKSKIITFNGVDGAGKTTILREFTELLEKKYRRNVIELRHRPSVLPILSAMKHGKKEAEKKTMEVLPRTGSNKSKLSSYIRFFYYLTDYILGQWVVFAKHSLRGEIVIYDRYYFDFINDARRTNIDLNSSFVKFFYKFVFKPEMNIFLFAPPEVILSRKQEMDEESIVNLTEKYKTLFDEFGQENKDQYVSIENINKEETMKTIEDIYVRTSL